MFQEFVRCSNKDIEQIIKKEMSGDVKQAMYGIGKDCSAWTVGRQGSLVVRALD